MRQFWFVAGGLLFTALLIAVRWWYTGRSQFTGPVFFAFGVIAVALLLLSYRVKGA